MLLNRKKNQIQNSPILDNNSRSECTLASCLIMGDSKWFIGVDSAPVLRAHQVTIGKKCIGLTT